MNRRLLKFLAIALAVALLAMLAVAGALSEPAGRGTLLAGCAVIFIAALIASIAGFAFSALAGAPLLLLYGDPLHAVSVIVVCSIAMQSYCVWALRRLIEWRRLLPFVVSGALTVPLGAWILVRTPPALFGAGFGIFLTAYATYMMWRAEPPVLRGGWHHDSIAGALSGLAGGLAGFPGSIVSIWCGMRGWTKERQRAVYQPFILAMQLVALACLRIHAPKAFAPEIFLLYVPLALAAASIGFAVFRRLTTRQFSVAVNALLLVSGIALFGGSL